MTHWGVSFPLRSRSNVSTESSNTGPYRLLRHPGYAGVLFGFVGFGLALQSWLSLLVLLLATTTALAYRARIEERFLVAELGDEYVLYMARTKRLLPYVW
ncbi:MAG TPA: isoprenylcysteine carboxylmethyltransferase family protein [Candidatus Dormibacteraeota bacterium]|nr:isoprenylcysteine carboxylmethyltransferase family protein [Candidatus Dormibacteraeota bacterium]